MCTWWTTGSTSRCSPPAPTGVDLCLLDRDDASPTGWHERRVPLDGPVHGVWYGHVAGVHPGQHYGFRTHGPWDPAARPAAQPRQAARRPVRARPRRARWATAPRRTGTSSTPTGRGDHDGPADPRDSVRVGAARRRRGHHLPRRADPAAGGALGADRRLRGARARPDQEHAGHPGRPARHLRRPRPPRDDRPPARAWASRPSSCCRSTPSPPSRTCVEKGLTNYWGYNTLGFFAPHAAYATRSAQSAGAGAVLAEVKGAIQLLHAAGLEVVLDVVYNHTCEGGDGGPHVSWRGLDTTGYYLHDGGLPGPLRRRHRVRQLARLPPAARRPDGARLAALLGRGGGRRRLPVRPRRHARPGRRRLRPRPPVPRRPADRPGAPAASSSSPSRGTSARAAGAPAASRRRWASGTTASATRSGPSGSPTRRRRRTAASGTASPTSRPGWPARSTCSGTATRRWPAVRSRRSNYVTAHDGFSMADLVAYEHKHNEANGEQGPRRQRRQPVLEPRRRGAGPRATPRASTSCRCGAARSATSWRPCSWRPARR